jgi:GNAT superfamily N-acetyltransferase
MSAPDLTTPVVGATITLRVSTPVGDVSVVGVVVTASDETWSIRRRDGSLTEVPVASVQARRDVPPSRAQRASVAEVQQVAALGWRALETARLGDWLLRASDGFTGRANSVLTIGDPGRPGRDAVAAVEAWYAERALPPCFQLPEPGASDGVRELLDQRGYTWSPPVHVMTAELGHVLRAADARVDPGAVALDDAPDDAWLATYRRAEGAPAAAARGVLAGHPAAVFASARSEGRTLAIARAAVDGRWAGLSAVEVAPEARRRGLAVQVTAAVLRWAGTHGARQVYLQTGIPNDPAVTLYQALGFTVHHDYRYANGPEVRTGAATPPGPRPAGSPARR